MLELRRPDQLPELVVLAVAVIKTVGGIEGVAEAIQPSILGARRRPTAVGAGVGRDAQAQPIAIKETRIFLLRQRRREVTLSNWRQQIRHQIFAKGWSLVPQVDQLRIAQGIKTVGQVKVSRMIGVVIR